MPNTQPTLPPSLAYIAERMSGQTHMKPAEVRRIILDAKVEPEDLQPWAAFDHPVQDSYGRKLAHRGDKFEIMVMSWRPGDFAAIHDHGHTQWGAVQIFGPAEHATFRIEDEVISTLARWTVTPGDVIGVSHTLLHQMGNPTEDTFFLSLHVYGEPDGVDSVTGDARVLDLKNNLVQHVDGGVFYALQPDAVGRTEPGPLPDFPTRLRHVTELTRRLRRMAAAGNAVFQQDYEAAKQDFCSPEQRSWLLQCLAANTDTDGHEQHSVYWRILNQELRHAAKLQNELLGEQRSTDAFDKYAALYDAVICQPCLDDFMANYLRFAATAFGVDFPKSSVISLGCGTGLVEEWMIQELGVAYENLYGIDLSEAMVAEARKRIQADPGDVLRLDPSVRLWDVAFSGLNVFQYLRPADLETAIQKTASILRPGGVFIGDFITPDHIRWYPNVMYSADKKVVSLRSPQLVEEGGVVFQESEITNISFMEDKMRVTYSGKHRRFLPPMHRVRHYFEKAFGGQVELFDAVTLEPLPDWADSCRSTRYVVVGRKGTGQ